jgi:hypothetical protein
VARCPSLRRRALIVLAACIALLPAVSLAANAGRAQGVACTPGATKVDGKRAMRFCGSATAAIHAGKYWFRLSEGSCAATSTFFTINVGTAVVAPNQTVPYFGLAVGQYPKAPKNRKPAGTDGVYHQGVIVIRWHGGAWDINGYARVKLWGDRTGGSFTGRTSAYPHKSIYGTFKC